MPNKTIYIRVDDLAKWEAIKDLPDFIHNALNPSMKGFQPLPPKCDTCGDYHFDYDPAYKDDRHKPIRPHKTYFKKGKK